MLTYKKTTKYSPQMFSQYLACSRFNGKNIYNAWHSASWLPWKNLQWGEQPHWRRAPRTDLRPQGPYTCPNPTERNHGSAGAPTPPPNPITKPPWQAAVPEQQRGDAAATAKPCLISNSKAEAPYISWMSSNSFPWAFLHLDHNPLSRINK